MKSPNVYTVLCLVMIFTVVNFKMAFAEHPRGLSDNVLDAGASPYYFQGVEKDLINNRGTKYQVSLENYQSDYLEDKPTWVVIHGFGHSPSNLEDQELQKNLKAHGLQVLQVDWSSITKRSIWSLWSAAGFIPAVADFVADSLIESTSLSGKNINCIGHSFGSYICWEIARKIENFNRLVALEPASKK
jgi:pimeloyl-ACP methyl ester carboxylesterase